MNKTMTEDPYQLSEINFTEAQWMRDHKFNPLSVKAARQARALVAAREAIEEAYAELERVAAALRHTCSQVQIKIAEGR